MKLAVIALTSCDGCQYSLVSREFADFLESRKIEVVYWPLAGSNGKLEEVDVALVEGSVTSERDLKLLYETRSRSEILVALGSCAHLGGVQGGLGMSRPISSYVRVDYIIRGCPIQTSEVVELLSKIATGSGYHVGEKRFSYVDREAFMVEDELIVLDQSKCFVCGRCVELCSKIGAGVLNYVYRGIQTLVSTPYREPFASSGCVYCGLCAAYCPAGAVAYRLDVTKILSDVRRGLITEAYIEPEALASISESENLTPHQVLGGFKALGLRRVSLYDPLSKAVSKEVGTIIARSPAEKNLLRRLLPAAKPMELGLNIPPNAVFVTQCLSWKSTTSRVLTAREAQIAFRRLSYSSLRSEYPDYVLLRSCELPKANTYAELVSYLERGVGGPAVFELCPGGCLLGGGQPISRKRLNSALKVRQTILKEIESCFR